MPFVPYSRKALIRKGFLGEPKTVGEHILKKRLDDKISQVDLAKTFGVDAATLLHWEKGHTAAIPAPKLPVVIQFLTYNPEPEPETVGAKLRWKRRALGWSTKEAATRNSVDQSTWEAWEKLTTWPRYPRFQDFLKEFLEMPNLQLLSRVRRVREPWTQRFQQGKKVKNDSFLTQANCTDVV